MAPPSALVVGSGISGITAAHRLHERGWNVTLIESSNRVGGVIQSQRIDGYLCEDGPNSMLIRSEAVRTFISRLGLDERLTPANTEASKRFIVRGGKPVAVPQSILGAIQTPLFSFGAKLRILKEPWITACEDPDESVASFVRRRLGPEFLEYAIAPMTSGIYAGDPEKLSIRYAFPRVWGLENESGSLVRGALKLRKARRHSAQPHYKSELVSFQDGLEELVERLIKPLSNQTYLKAEFQGLRRSAHDQWTAAWLQAGKPQSQDFDHIIFTAPPHRWASWDLPVPLAGRLLALPKLSFPAVNTLVLGFKREEVAHPLDGFGMLIPKSENQPILGTIFSSSLFPHRAPDGHVSLMCFLGGMTQPEAAGWDEYETVQKVLESLKELLGITGDPTFHHFTAWPKAIPQYHLDYGDFDSGLHQIEEKFTGIHFQGNFRGGPGLNDCIENALTLAERIDNARH
tara:strand:- start:47174 stop:48550 length:1377 start_codon:yes stop_codon:yes gene_type:complete